MGVRIEQVDWDDERAVELRRQMDAEMLERYGDRPNPDPDAVARALHVEAADLAATLLALDDDGSALGHVAVRRHGDEWELKRLVVTGAARGRGVATALVDAGLEVARAGGAARMILQTGDRQPDAVALYEKLGWTPIPIYPPYEVVPFSLCFEKVLRPEQEQGRSPRSSAETQERRGTPGR
ncbi:acetyltransferase (GNAT) family protein [Motilibacter peucedani]|uniref:Acetyltransferase (GNAT) family protein n=1 Tax=Motilibacter peucedani TaxID=598650 RepID=A0A420XKC2_9ACTN|nr:GNAT family N-acetyltransferase [Motilibacter peucedani]RKS67965.1 acetyltransferase (GNAT) family protein [Motilibacter peucedani]